MAKGVIGGKIVLEGASKYNSDLKSIKTNMAELRSEMKLANSQYATTANSAEALAKKQEIYGKQIEQVSKKVDTYADMVEAARKMQEKAATQIDEYTKELEEARKALDDMKKSGDASNEEIKEQEKAVKDLAGKLEGANKAYDTASQKIQQYTTAGNNAKAELNNLNQELAQNDKYLDEANRSADGCAKSIDEYGNEVDEAGEKTSRFGDIVKGSIAADVIKAGLKALCDGIKTAADAAIEAGANFEAGMDKVAAISGATAEELDALTAKAEEMGAKTMFSASESADALSYMAMAGWKAEDMLAGLEPVMSLAAASGSDLATTSDILTDDLTAFGLSAQDAGRFADVLAAASANANTNVELLGETFKYAAPVAGALGYSLEDISVAAGLMANNGIKASSAGTALRSIMTRMAKPTKESAQAMEDLGLSLTDNEGKMYTFRELMEQMREKFAGLTEAEKAQEAAMLAGKNAMSGLLAVVNSSDDDFNKLCEAIDNSNGAAKQMADTMQDNLKGKVTILKSALEGLGIEVEKTFDKTLKEAVDGATDAVDRLHKQVSDGAIGVSLQKMSDSLGDFLKNALELGEKALPPVLEALSWILDHSAGIASAIAGFMAAKVVMEAISAWKMFKTTVEGATIAQKMLNLAMEANPAGLIAAAIGTLCGFIGQYVMTMKDATEEANKYKEAAEKSAQAIDDKIEADKREAEELDRAADKIRELNGLEELNAAQKQELKMCVDKLNGAYPDLNLQIDENGKLTEESTRQLELNIDALKRQFELQKQQEEIQTILEENYELEKQLAEVTDQHKEATERMEEAQAKLNEQTEKYDGQARNLSPAIQEWGKKFADAREEVENTQESIDSINGTLADNEAKLDELSGKVAETSAAIQEDAAGVQEAVEQTTSSVEGVTSTLSEYWVQLDEEQQKALDKMVETVAEFDGMFDKMNTSSKMSAEEVTANLKANADAMGDYADNVHKAMELANESEGETGEATKAIVNHLIGLGIDGAAELAMFLDEAEADSDTFHELLANFGDFEQAQADVEQALYDWNLGFNNGFDETISTVTTKHEELKTEQEQYQADAEQSATTHKDEMVKIHQDSATEQAQAIRDGTEDIVTAIGEQIDAQKEKVETELEYDGTTSQYFKDVGTNSDQSWADAIKDNKDKVTDASSDMISDLISGVEDDLDISGDSCGVATGWGSAITSSLAESIRSGSGEVAAAVHELCEEACNSFDLSPLVDRIEGLIADGVGRAEAAIGAIINSI